MDAVFGTPADRVEIASKMISLVCGSSASDRPATGARRGSVIPVTTDDVGAGAAVLQTQGSYSRLEFERDPVGGANEVDPGSRPRIALQLPEFIGAKPVEVLRVQ